MRLGYYTIALAFPVVELHKARTRVIVTATHTHEQIDGLVAAFKKLADNSTFFEDLKNGTKLMEDQGSYWPTIEKTYALEAKL